MKRQALRIILPLLLLILGALPGQAEAVQWQFIERCFELVPTRPVWNGVILMTDWAGIHGIRPEYPTPYVTAFIPWGETTLGGAGLSPDGRWYAVTIGELEFENFNRKIHLSALRVYSVVDPQIVYEIDWQHDLTDTLSYNQMRWLNNDELIYTNAMSNVIVDFRTGESRRWTSSLDPLETGYNGLSWFYPAPDWTRAIHRHNIPRTENTLKTIWSIFDLEQGQDTTTLDAPFTLTPFYWSDDSSRFAGEIMTASGDYQVGLYDRDGKLTDPPFTLPDDLRPAFNPSDEYLTGAWSPDNRYLALLAIHSNDSTDRAFGQANKIALYIVDRQTHMIIDTCQARVKSGMAWSPDSRFLAVDRLTQLSEGRKTPIYLLDLEHAQFSIAAYHSVASSGIIGWRP